MSFSAFCIDVPATSANLGPGFDSFGLAVMLHNSFAVQPADDFSVNIAGYSAPELEHHQSNLVFSIYRQLCRDYRLSPTPFALTNTNRIPLFGGIGSSASAIVAGIAIVDRIHTMGWDNHSMLRIAFGFETHLDNIAAAIFGGFVATSFDQDSGNPPLVIQKQIRAPLCCWMVVPHLRVATCASRTTIPTSVSHADAAFNLAHAAQVAIAFEREDWNMLAQVMRDRLHQPYRHDSCARLLTLATRITRLGGYAMCLSGSGPAVMVLCDTPNQQMQELVQQHMQHQQLDYTQLTLTVDNQGVRHS